jgi:diacylglycerol kinase (ATP)
LARASLRPELLPTRGPGDATSLAREAIAGGADLILVLGGDGTINEAANGMIGSKVPLGILPGGTANVLAMELGLGSRLERAAQRLSQCVERRIAIGKLTRETGESRYFFMMAGVGLDATIVVAVNPWLKSKTGKLAYWVAGTLQFLRTVSQFHARVHGETGQHGFVLASRVRNYGGDLEIASGSSLLSSDFEVVLFRGSNPIRYAAYMASVGIRMVQKMPGVRTVQAREIEVLGDAPIQIDGEYVGQTPARFEIVPDALTLLMPETYR